MVPVAVVLLLFAAWSEAAVAGSLSSNSLEDKEEQVIKQDKTVHQVLELVQGKVFPLPAMMRAICHAQEPGGFLSASCDVSVRSLCPHSGRGVGVIQPSFGIRSTLPPFLLLSDDWKWQEAEGGREPALSGIIGQYCTGPAVFTQVMSKECRGQYNTHCLKLNLLKIVSKAGSGALPILPGVSLSWVRPHLELEPTQLEDPEGLDSLLLEQLGDTLSNISLSIKILDREAPLSFAKAYLGESSFTGRRKDKYGGALAAAGLMSGGTMLAVGLSALAAMAGKALMASLLALMLAGIAALKGNSEDSKTTYEIVAKPVVSHQHTHSSEVIHGGHHYKRSIPALQMAYKMQMPK